MREIPLTQGLVALVDDEDYERLAQHKWCVLRTGSNVYAKRTKRALLMHREVMLPPPGMVVDHINHNGLDNRRSNLRICSQAENAVHRRVPRSVWQIPNGRWRAVSQWRGVTRHLGYFATQREALAAVEAFRRVNHPGFGVTLG
jgi:hypothetical protein